MFRVVFVRSFVDQCSSSMDFSQDSDRARSITRVSACLTALEGVLKGSSSFSPIRRYVLRYLFNYYTMCMALSFLLLSPS